MIRAGQFSRRIRIDRRVTGVDGANQPLDGWEPVMTLWAFPRGLSGLGAIREQTGGVPATITRYSWRIRHRPTGIDTGMRVVEIVNGQDGDIFQITGLLHDYASREWTDIVCELGGNNG